MPAHPPRRTVDRIAIALQLLCLALLAALPATATAETSHERWGELLERHVRGNQVDYAGFKADEAKLDRYLEELARVRTSSLSRNEQFAFYINAYNAHTVKMVLSGYPGLNSIKDLGGWFGSPWKKKLCRIDGQILTLDQIEHEILRPRFKDPRVHFAINCAARSCPPLRAEAYTGAKLESQLDTATRAFINDPARNYFQKGILYLSKIFDWYAKDFAQGVLPFVAQYVEGHLKERLTARDKIEIEYLAYDWSLNGA